MVRNDNDFIKARQALDLAFKHPSVIMFFTKVPWGNIDRFISMEFLDQLYVNGVTFNFNINKKLLSFGNGSKIYFIRWDGNWRTRIRGMKYDHVVAHTLENETETI